MALYNGPRHRSWASNTVILAVVFVLTLIAVVVVDVLGEPPSYLVGLLGAASTALFAAAGSDHAKREKEIAKTAERAEAKVDAVIEHEPVIAKAEANRVEAEEARASAEDQREADHKHREGGEA